MTFHKWIQPAKPMEPRVKEVKNDGKEEGRQEAGSQEEGRQEEEVTTSSIVF